jgi:hypothetical protein
VEIKSNLFTAPTWISISVVDLALFRFRTARAFALITIHAQEMVADLIRAEFSALFANGIFIGAFAGGRHRFFFVG